MDIRMKRIYDKASEDDGKRILVDRLWPRGVSKERANLDKWLKEIGPSNELRKWFNHDAGKFNAFKERYLKELENGEQAEALKTLKKIIEGYDGPVTLLFAAKNEMYNQVWVLKEILEGVK